MMLANDERLTSVPVIALEFSVRTLDGLKKVGATNLGEAYWSVVNRSLHRQRGIGPRSVKEVEDMVATVLAATPVVPKAPRERKLVEVLEMFLRWTGALAITGSATPEAWRELVVIRDKAQALMEKEQTK
jgi:hypothetical protein